MIKKYNFCQEPVGEWVGSVGLFISCSSPAAADALGFLLGFGWFGACLECLEWSKIWALYSIANLPLSNHRMPANHKGGRGSALPQSKTSILPQEKRRRRRKGVTEGQFSFFHHWKLEITDGGWNFRPNGTQNLILRPRRFTGQIWILRYSNDLDCHCQWWLRAIWQTNKKGLPFPQSKSLKLMWNEYKASPSQFAIFRWPIKILWIGKRITQLKGTFFE